MATNDDRYKVYLDAYIRAAMEQMPSTVKQGSSVKPIIAAACQALAVRHALDKIGPAEYSDFIDALKKLGLAD